MKQEQIDNWFSYHPPTPEQIEKYAKIRAAAKAFAEVINAEIPDSADKTAAMRHLRETMMAANQALACYVGKETTEPQLIATGQYDRT